MNIYTPNLSKILTHEKSVAINLLKNVPIKWSNGFEDVTSEFKSMRAKTATQTQMAVGKATVSVEGPNDEPIIKTFTGYKQMLKDQTGIGDKIKQIAEQRRSHLVSKNLQKLEEAIEANDPSLLGKMSIPYYEKGGFPKVNSFLYGQSHINLWDQSPNKVARYFKPADKDVVIYDKLVIQVPKPGKTPVISDKRVGYEPVKIKSVEDIIYINPSQIPTGSPMSNDEFEKKQYSKGQEKMVENVINKSKIELAKLKKYEAVTSKIQDDIKKEKAIIDKAKEYTESQDELSGKIVDELQYEEGEIIDLKENIEQIEKEGVEITKKAEKEAIEQSKKYEITKKQYRDIKTDDTLKTIAPYNVDNKDSINLIGSNGELILDQYITKSTKKALTSAISHIVQTDINNYKRTGDYKYIVHINTYLKDQKLRDVIKNRKQYKSIHTFLDNIIKSLPEKDKFDK